MADATYVKLVLPSEIRMVDVAHVASEKVAELAGLGEEGALDLSLAVREAVVNAMTHGNRLDPARAVHLTFLTGPTELCARVRDRGRGFDPRATADPTTDENLLRTSGRGLLLIRAYVDRVTFRFRKGRGMEVTLIKKIPGAGASAGRPVEGAGVRRADP